MERPTLSVVGWLSERIRFVTAAARAGVAWFLGVWKYATPPLTVAGLAGVGGWIVGRVPLWVALAYAVALVALVLGEGAFRLWREADPLGALGALGDVVKIEPYDGVKKYERDEGASGWVQHILVTNTGRKASLRASLTTHISGLDRPHGKTMRLRWESTDEETLTLGKGEQGLLRFGEFGVRGDAREVCFFPVPRHRHQPGTGYHPTQPFPIAAAELTFDLCVRDESDVSGVWPARITFAPDGEPMLSFSEPA